MGYGYRESGSPLATIEWWADVDGDFEYTEAASEFWGFAFGVLADGTRSATLIGPATVPRQLRMVPGEHHWGVELPPHVFLRGIDAKPLNELRELEVDGDWFVLAGVRYAIPDRDSMPQLLDALAGQGVLAAEPAVASALAGEAVHYSERSLRRMFSDTASMRRKHIQQIQRARTAYRLLHEGRPLAEAAALAGYADQAHMTRAFALLAGSSPGRILAGDGTPFDSRPV